MKIWAIQKERRKHNVPIDENIATKTLKSSPIVEVVKPHVRLPKQWRERETGKVEDRICSYISPTTS